MKPATILKKLITIYYYLMGIGLFASSFALCINIFKQKQVAPKLLKGDTLYPIDSIKVIIAEISSLFLAFLFFYTILLLRNSFDLLSKKNQFSKKVIINFKKIGVLFIICGFGELFGKLIFSSLLKNNFDINFDHSVILLPVMGLFFMYLSEIFSNAREIQTENDLTV